MNLSQYIKNPEEIIHMRRAGQAAASVLDYITPFVQKGVSTNELNQRCHQYITETLKAIPAPLNYRGFPKSICTSVNHVVCHGIPDDKVLKDGDILNIDVTVILDGYHGDTSRMFLIGNVKPHAKRLCDIARECLYVGIDMVKPGQSLYDIGVAIEQYAKKNHYSSVKDFCGHGIGKVFHEPGFQVLHYDAPEQKALILEPGLTFTIEPMINIGKCDIKILKDGWTVITKDKTLSAQWEHTLLVTESGVEILTQK
ncbi:type I methionyl aminopeptidase [Candidatus Synchoanobacter obligatus]|uniref:Methionine aminopeptidase n=1 Tax=Candidatus Synchoanobacter obligatus TaxID=2919597 RepID=A0ABT1L5W7_9GAMM|nr:type I methionyl aminopeptidase [Candidatus Synchoanobacter obligatus]MCP8352306.1 type I methionyl aminopeptidase [Candidatus Synchoanobacter obligatus]